MRRLLPDSIAGWVILVVITGLVASQLIAIAIHYDSRRQAQTVLENVRIAERVVTLTRLIGLISPEQRPDIVRSVSRPSLIVTWEPNSAVDATDPGNMKTQLLTEVIADRQENLGLRNIQVNYIDAPLELPLDADVIDTLLSDDAQELRGTLRQALGQQLAGPTFVISLQLLDSTWLNFAAVDQATVPAWSHQSVALIAAMLIAIIALSVLGIRRLTAPLGTLAQAAERLGRDVNAPPLAERGASDVRKALRAFNNMQERIQRFIEDRTRMIAAISHDLRTPITRLRLRAEFIDDAEQQARMLADLDDMETMIQSTLSFAREEANPEPRRDVDLVALLRSVCEDSLDVELTIEPAGTETVLLRGQPVALRRGFCNLIDNAVKYGEHARVGLSIGADNIAVAVDDDGPGLPEEELERVFRPFYRVEQSRSRDTGGVGLGLAVARTVFRAHGGDVSLANRPPGGLRATVTLPHATANGG
jgi:signal transduction histidine kinase